MRKERMLAIITAATTLGLLAAELFFALFGGIPGVIC